MKHINIKNPDRYNCSGCSACVATCPKQCIKLAPDSEGFLYPIVDINLCVDCGACEKICPWLHKVQQKEDLYPKVFAAKNKNNVVRSVSTSGGLFSSLAECIISKNGFVWGASFVAINQRVEHICVSNVNDLSKIRGSKYVQSFIGDVFRKIKEQLQEGYYVLFTGTPCQCAGLKSFLRNDYENLFIVDILCHSTPSPKIFNDTLSQLGQNVTNVRFRDKSLGWRGSYHFQLFTQENSVDNDTYLTLFFKGFINRPSCYRCKFTDTKRPSDITIGDYWNIKAVDANFEDKLGASCLLINNSHGMLLFQDIRNSLNAIETPLDPAMQSCMYKNVKEPRGRNKYWKDYNIHMAIPIA